LKSRADVVLIEAARGLAVPLTPDLLTVDFAAAQGWRLILVSSGKLGSVNHTVLSLESALARGLDVLGVAYNFCPDADPAIDRDSAQYITQYMQKKGLPPALSVVPKVDLSQIPDGLPSVDFSALFDSIIETSDSCNNHDK
jgi:dethiobiotin synthetase